MSDVETQEQLGLMLNGNEDVPDEIAKAAAQKA